MSQNCDLPIILLINGSFHYPTVWRFVEPLLQDSGYQTATSNLPSNGSEKADPDIWLKDVKLVAGQITALVNQGKDVVVVMHSYAGAPGSEACKGLSKSTRAKEGKKGGVISCVYLCAFMVPPGMTLYESAADDRGKLELDMNEVTGLLSVKNPEAFGQDLPQELIDANAAELTTMDPGTLAAKPTYQPYLEMPVTYLICTIDWAIPATKQRYYVEEAIKAGGKDNLNVIEMDCGHSPMLKNPNFAVEVIDKAAKAALGVL